MKRPFNNYGIRTPASWFTARLWPEHVSFGMNTRPGSFGAACLYPPRPGIEKISFWSSDLIASLAGGRTASPVAAIPFTPHQTHSIDDDLCIRCAICVRLSAIKGEPVGLAALGRGIQKHPGPPSGKSWAGALRKDPLDYCHQCPTGAIAPKLG